MATFSTSAAKEENTVFKICRSQIWYSELISQTDQFSLGGLKPRRMYREVAQDLVFYQW